MSNQVNIEYFTVCRGGRAATARTEVCASSNDGGGVRGWIKSRKPGKKLAGFMRWSKV